MGCPAPRGDAPGLPHLPAHPHAPLSPSSLPWSKTTTDGRSGARSWRKGPKSQGREVVQQQRESSDFERAMRAATVPGGWFRSPLGGVFPAVLPGSFLVSQACIGGAASAPRVPACRGSRIDGCCGRGRIGASSCPPKGKNNKKKNRLWFALYSFRMSVKRRSQVAKLGFPSWCDVASLHAQAPATGGQTRRAASSPALGLFLAAFGRRPCQHLSLRDVQHLLLQHCQPRLRPCPPRDTARPQARRLGQ